MPVHLAMYILAVDAFQIKEEVRQNAPSYFKEKHSSAFSLNGLKALFPKLHFQYFPHIIFHLRREHSSRLRTYTLYKTPLNTKTYQYEVIQ